MALALVVVALVALLGGLVALAVFLWRRFVEGLDDGRNKGPQKWLAILAAASVTGSLTACGSSRGGATVAPPSSPAVASSSTRAPSPLPLPSPPPSLPVICPQLAPASTIVNGDGSTIAFDLAATPAQVLRGTSDVAPWVQCWAPLRPQSTPPFEIAVVARGTLVDGPYGVVAGCRDLGTGRIWLTYGPDGATDPPYWEIPMEARGLTDPPPWITWTWPSSGYTGPVFSGTW